jgi:hypothetical protein
MARRSTEVVAVQKTNMAMPHHLGMLLAIIIYPLLLGCGSGAPNGLPDLAERDLGGPATGTKRVFVTAATFGGDLASAGNSSSGRAGADHICSAAATAAGLGGAWVAWLSDATNAIDHVNDVGPWHLTDANATIAFRSRADLSGDPLAAIDHNENETTNNSDGVWTGTAGGAKSGNSCQSWMSAAAAAVGTFGKSDYMTGGAWSSFQTLSCNSSLHLYCFEQ